jgi:MerR family transcriptional regulator, copper efflux regulator
MQTMSIGQLAKGAKVGIDTVRFYEKHGLLPTPQRKASGYRQYSADDARRLVFIRRAKELGFALADIGELLRLRGRADKSGRSVERVRAVAKRKLQAVEAKMMELERMRDVLKELVTACPGHGDADRCPILRAFDNEGVQS